MPLRSTRAFDVNRLLLIAILALLSYSVFYKSRNAPGELGLNGVEQSVKDAIVPSSRGSKNGSVGKSKEARYAVMSMNTKCNSYDYVAVSSKDRYARKWGYDMLWSWDEPREGGFKYWDKLSMIANATKATLAGERSYEWVLMIDYDTLITNTSITLDELVEDSLQQAEKEGKKRDDIDMIVTPDCFPLNVGAMIFRTTPWTLNLMKEWRAGKDVKNKDGDSRSEQDVLQDFIKANTHRTADKSVTVLQWKMNAFPKEIGCYDNRDPIPWKPGMFLVHFAGAWAHVKEEDPTGVLMRKYYPFIDRANPHTEDD